MIVVGVGRIAMKQPDTKSSFAITASCQRNLYPRVSFDGNGKKDRWSADCQQWAVSPSYSLTVAQ